LLFSVIILAKGGVKMNISLTPQLEALVKNKVESGLYGSASEVMRDALRLLEARDQRQHLRVEELRTEIKKGLDSGEPTPLDISAIKARGRKRLAAQQNEANA
jgi:antitoxin ParD1/3/4